MRNEWQKQNCSEKSENRGKKTFLQSEGGRKVEQTANGGKRLQKCEKFQESTKNTARTSGPLNAGR